MANSEAVKYFKEHKDVPREVLHKQLINAGYPEDVITEAEAAVGGVMPALTRSSASKAGSFRRVGGFSIGFAGAVVMYAFIFMVFDDLFGGLVGLAVQGFVAWKYWRTRRSFVFGFTVAPILLGGLAIIMIMYMFSQW